MPVLNPTGAAWNPVRGLFGLLLAIFLVLPGMVSANEVWFAKIVSIQGSVEIKRKQETEWKPASSGQTVAVADMLKVGPHSRAALLLRDQAVIRLDQNTMVTFKESKKESGTLLELLQGALHFFSTDPARLKVITPFVNAAIEGTEFVIRVAREQTELSVLEGKIRADNEYGTMLIKQGQSAVAGRQQSPELRLVLKPRDAVHWTLYYPPVIDSAAFGSERAIPSAVRLTIQEAFQAFMATGDANGALEILEGIAEHQRGIPFLLCRSSIFLAVGAVEEAREDLRRILTVNPGEANALALQAVIALVQDDKSRALELADQAVQANPDSAAALMALSYVKQADFKFDQAMEIIRSLVKKYPHQALAWARMSDLELGQGRLQQALQAADRAVALNPNLSMIQTVLGFAYLTMTQIDPSEAAFQKAIRINPVDPLARLGLGLAEIRRGNLPAGREHLEIAVALDPLNSLLRSYLGKAYYEEKREHKAGDQLRIAKQLDPNDPTPWFYDAILKQSINRPIEALHDLQESIARNDNRAVYRSHLLLDQDLAARSASLARIYSDAGFEQLALVEGWRSLNTDPTNFSAHRFLADSYSALPRHEIARVSELLQAQLLQPININPLQPQLAESDLSVFRGAGPASAGFSEYSSLFTQNGASLQASTIFGENSTFGDEVVVSGIRDNVSFSLGQYYYRTDGFRENNDLTRKLYNAFLQAGLSPQTSVQAEYRFNEQDNGDLSLLFDSDFYSQNQRQEQRTDFFRLGLHHAFTPRTHFLGSVVYRNLDADATDQERRLHLGLEGQADGWQGETQLQYHGAKADWIAGGGYFDGSNTTTNRYSLVFACLPTLEFPPCGDRIDIEQGNAYIYSLVHGFSDRLTLTLETQVEDFDRKPENYGTEYFSDLTTIKIPIGIHFYHPSGIGLQLKATLVDQRGVFHSVGDTNGEKDSDTFLVMDASINYRMPKRWGILTFGVRNLWDQDFHFQDTDPANPDIAPERLVFMKITMDF